MGWLKFLAVAVSMWGAATFATVAGAVGGEPEELHTISSWTAHMNHYFPDLQVRVTTDLMDRIVQEKILRELELLEEYLHGDVQLPLPPLQFLACRNIICGGD